MPKATRRTPNTSGWVDPNRKDPGHDLNAGRTTRPAKKDKARWCKGKVGREHEYTSNTFPNHPGLNLQGWICKGCGRQTWRAPRHGKIVPR